MTISTSSSTHKSFKSKTQGYNFIKIFECLEVLLPGSFDLSYRIVHILSYGAPNDPILIPKESQFNELQHRVSYVCPEIRFVKESFRTETKIFTVLKKEWVFFTKHQRKHEPSPYPPSSTPPHEDGKTKKSRVW